MKIAFLIHGHLRTYRDNDSIVPMLLARYPSADVFLQTFAWRNFAGNKWHADEFGADEQVTHKDMAWLASAYPNVVASTITDARSGGELLAPQHAKMGFRVAREVACKQRQDYECLSGKQYDLVFMTRYDVGFREPVVLPETIDQNTLYGGYNANQAQHGRDGEVFVYGAPHVIDACMMPAVPPELAGTVEGVGYLGEWLMTETRKLRGFAYQAHRVPHFFYRSRGGQLNVMGY